MPGWVVRMAYRLCALGLVLLVAAAQAPPVLAHAALVRSEPAAGAVLPRAPQVILLVYSENLDPGRAAVRLLDAGGNVIVDGPGSVDPAHPLQLRLALPPLPDGVYSAVWQVRSAVDGHVTNGSLGFSIGASSPRASLLPPPGTPDLATAPPAPADTVLRWLGYLAAAVAAGSLLFGLLVWRPAFRRWQERSETADRQASRLLVRLSYIGIGTLALVTLAVAGLTMVETLQAGLGQHEAGLFAGRIGTLLAVRLALLAVLAGTLTRLPPAGAGPAGPWGVAAALGAGVLLTFSLLSHAPALAPPLALVATAADWIHLVAMAAWFGGLLPLAMLLRRGDERPGLVQVLVPRFSIVALPSTILLALTGTFNALLHVRTLEALALTSYGRALLVKVGLFGALLLLGALNLLVLSPYLKRAAGRAVGWLRRTVRIELSLAALVLLAVAVLLNVAPAFEALAAQRKAGTVSTVRVDRVRLVLRVAPLQVGDNEFGIDVSDPRPGASAVPATVLLRLTMVEHDMGTIQVETTAGADRRYTARGSYLSVAGPWQIEVIVRRTGFDDVRHTFKLLVPLEASGP